MYLVSCTNTHHDVTDSINHGIVKNMKTWISWERNIIFLRNKRILNLCLRWHILRSYRFVVEVTFENVGERSMAKCICPVSLFFVVSKMFWKFVNIHGSRSRNKVFFLVSSIISGLFVQLQILWQFYFIEFLEFLKGLGLLEL